MIQKRTVYLPVNTDDPSLVVQEYQREITVDLVKDVEGYFFTPEQLNEYTANVIKQALETAAKKVEIHSDSYSSLSRDFEYAIESGKIWVPSNSITNTFDETFKKFEV